MLPRSNLESARWVTALLALLGPRQARQPARLAFTFLWLYPTLRRNCTWHGPLITSLKNFPGVWLTVDDGPDPRCTPAYLEILRAFHARASFFAIGKRVMAFPALAHRILDEGHTIENHTFTHPAASWWGASPWRTAREIHQGSQAIIATTGFVPRFFRPPVGMVNPWVHAHLGTLEAVGWSGHAGDACPAAPSSIAERLLSRAQPGAILLLHEGSGARHRARALELLLEGLSRMGLACQVPEAPAQQ